MSDVDRAEPAPAGQTLLLVLSWAAVGVPLAWGVWMTVKKALLLFG
jgi:hypothetical protein